MSDTDGVQGLEHSPIHYIFFVVLHRPKCITSLMYLYNDNDFVCVVCIYVDWLLM